MTIEPVVLPPPSPWCFPRVVKHCREPLPWAASGVFLLRGLRLSRANSSA